MKNTTFSKTLIFILLVFVISVFTSCKVSKNTTEKTTQEVKDFAFDIIETSLDYAVGKVEKEVKDFTLNLLKKQDNSRIFISPLGFTKFEVKRNDGDSLTLNISPVWLVVADSCRSKINHYLKFETELVKILVNTTFRKAINKASTKIKPYQIIIHKNSVGQYFSPNRLLIIEINEGKNENFMIKVSPNIVEMGDIIKRLVRELLDGKTKNL
jgi:hypothetical protein